MFRWSSLTQKFCFFFCGLVMAINWQPYPFLISLSLISQIQESKNKKIIFWTITKILKTLVIDYYFCVFLMGLHGVLAIYSIYILIAWILDCLNKEENSKEKKSLKRQIKGRLLLKNKSTNFFYSCFKSNYYRESYSINLVA
jgi:hypothetical protein